LNANLRETLLGQVRVYLEGLGESDPGDMSITRDESSDLFSVFVELAATRNEVRTQSRLIKDALDQFRAVFETLQLRHAAVEQELKDARARAREESRKALRTLLLDVIDVRDRLTAGLASTPVQATGWFGRWSRRAPPDSWREGLSMILRRLDEVLAARRVTLIDLVGRTFSPLLARVVATIDDPTVADGIVVSESRAGFMWEDELLRPAEVIVARHEAARAMGR
jgi:molecular chaperone GrpE